MLCKYYISNNIYNIYNILIEKIKMNEIRYTDGHKLPIKLIRTTLYNIGCEEIQNNDYNIEERSKNRFDGLVPDFICKYNQEYAAVEIGSVQNPDKIRRLC